MSWWDDVTGFVSNNKDILSTVAATGLSAAKNSSQDKAAKDYQAYLQQQEQANYNNYLSQVDAYNTQGANAAAASAANSARAAANSRASSAAAAATERNARKAAGKASKASQKGYKEALAMLAPYVQAGEKILPAKQATYLEALNRMGAMGNYLNSPDQMAKANASIPAFAVNIPLPERK